MLLRWHPLRRHLLHLPRNCFADACRIGLTLLRRITLRRVSTLRSVAPLSIRLIAVLRRIARLHWLLRVPRRAVGLRRIIGRSSHHGLHWHQLLLFAAGRQSLILPRVSECRGTGSYSKGRD